MKYSKKTVERICNFIRTDSYSTEEVCAMAGIGKETYYRWLKKYPEFAAAVEKAEDELVKSFVRDAKKSLKKKILGFTIPETTKIVVGTGRYDGSGNEIVRIKQQKMTEKHFPPDTAAIIFTLCNLDPDNWKNRQQNELTGKDGKDLFANLSDEELDAKIAECDRVINI